MCLAQLVMLWSEITANWNEFRVANLFGTGTYIVPAFVCLSLLGLAFVRVRPICGERISGWDQLLYRDADVCLR